MPIKPHDGITSVDIDFATHTTALPNRQYRYPDLHTTLVPALGAYEKVVVAGFHLADCVYNTATLLQDQGKEVFVDEELTDQPGIVVNSCDFRPHYSHLVTPTDMRLRYQRVGVIKK